MANVHNVVLVLQDCSLVVVDIQVVGGTEDGHDTGEASGSRLAVHAVTGVLSFMGTNDGQQIVLLQESACCRVRKEVRTASDVVVHKVLLRLLLSKVLERVCPKNIAHETVCGWLSETIDALEVLQGVKFGTETAVNAQELLVHYSSQGQSAERLHAGLVNILRVFVFALELEGEVVCQVAALVVSAE